MIEALALGAPGGFALAGGLSYAAPDLVRRRSAAFRRLIAVLAAAGAVFAHTKPTGVALVDILCAPALAAGVALLASRARPWTVAVAAAVGAVASVTSPEPVAAFGAAGAALAMALTVRRSPLVTALVAAGVVNAVLRMRFGGPFGAEIPVAVAALGLIVASGYGRLQRQSRRRLGLAVTVAGGVVVGAVLGGGVAVAAARPALDRGVDGALAALTAASLAESGETAEQFAAARDGFGRADRVMRSWLARPALAVPVLGPHIRALRAVAGTGLRLAATGEETATTADLDAIEVRDGRVPLDRVAALTEPLDRASKEVAFALDRLREARSRWLLPPVADRLDASTARLTDALRSLRISRDLVAVVPAMLGSDRPHRWFVAVQTPSEARGSGGMTGNFGELVAAGGRLELTRFGRIDELNEGGEPAAGRILIGPADYVARYRRFSVASTWQNVNLSPDFPSVGRVIAGLYPQSGGHPIDGVIGIDPSGLAALLRLTGPLQVASWSEAVTADNVERILLFEQYRVLPTDQRVDFLGEVVRELFGRLTSGKLAGARQILDALGPAVAQKHLRLTSLDATQDAALEAAGANGAMAPVRGDAFAVITQNATGNKIDWFLRRRVDYSVTVDPSTGSLSGHATITLANQAPATGLPDYVIGSATKPPLPPGTNRMYLSVYTPWALVGARTGGRPATFESESEAGRRVYSTYVDVAAGQEVVVELDLEGALSPGRRYRLDLHAQPVVEPDTVSVGVNDGARHRLVLDGDRTVVARLSI